MAGTHTTKRRRISAPVARLARGVRDVKPLGVSSPHAGAKPSYVHLAQTASRATEFARAQDWHAATGKPLPPHLRPRSPLPGPAALGLRDRFANYLYAYPPLGTRTTPAILNDTRLTGPQRRRVLHKAGAHGERPAGSAPKPPPPSPKAPEPPAPPPSEPAPPRMRASVPATTVGSMPMARLPEFAYLIMTEGEWQITAVPGDHPSLAAVVVADAANRAGSGTVNVWKVPLAGAVAIDAVPEHTVPPSLRERSP